MRDNLAVVVSARRSSANGCCSPGEGRSRGQHALQVGASTMMIQYCRPPLALHRPCGRPLSAEKNFRPNDLSSLSSRCSVYNEIDLAAARACACYPRRDGSRGRGAGSYRASRSRPRGDRASRMSRRLARAPVPSKLRVHELLSFRVSGRPVSGVRQFVRRRGRRRSMQPRSVKESHLFYDAFGHQ